MKNVLLLISAVIIGLLVIACTPAVKTVTPTSCETGAVLQNGVCVVPNTSNAGGGTETTGTDNTIKAFSITAKNFRFYMNGVESPELRVKQGDKVKIEFTNEEGFHDWVIDEFNARTKRVNAGESDSVEFIADKKGSFEYYCSVGTHRQMGMKGSLIVE